MKISWRILALLTLVLIAVNACDSSPDKNPSESSSPESSASKNDQPQPAPTDSTSGTAANGAHYRINSAQSHFTAQVGVGGLLSSLGHDHTIAIKDFNGDVQLTPDTLQPASFQLTIKASSLSEVAKEFTDKDRQEVNRAVQEKALETAKYPEIVFKSTGVSANKRGEGQYQATITGNLTMHGVTHPVSFPAQIRFEGNNLHATGEFTVLHSEYKMERISAGGGTVKAKDPIKLTFQIVANKA